MRNIQRLFEEKILDELEAIPDSELPKVYEMIRYIKLGILASKEGSHGSKFSPEHLKDKPDGAEPLIEQGDDEYPKVPYFRSKEMAE